MNVFVLCVGRCGSATFAEACSHIKNYTASHESLCRELGEQRLAYPENHIEVDNRLAWFLGRLEEKHGDSAVYVYLRRRPEEIASSYNKRWANDLGIMSAYAKGVLKSRRVGSDVAVDMVRTVSENIEFFLRGKSQVFIVDIEHPEQEFQRFWQHIGAEGDLEQALAEFGVKHNANVFVAGEDSAVTNEENFIIKQHEEWRDRLQQDKSELLREKNKLKSDMERLQLNWQKAEFKHQCELEKAQAEHQRAIEKAERAKNIASQQVKSLQAKLRNVHGSASYQLGMAITRHVKSPKGWLKMPLAIYRVVKRHRAKVKASVNHCLRSSDSLGGARGSIEKLVMDMSDPGRALMCANAIAKNGDPSRAISLAESNLSPDLAYTSHVLRANIAITAGNEALWLEELNSYLSNFDAGPLQLGRGHSAFDRLRSAELSSVTEGPLISVIMPAWNSVQTIRRAIESILNQTWRNLELIIVDDCSTDGTWSVMLECAAADSRVKILRNRVNVGPYVSKNIALMQAAGEWITGQDADDWSLPQRLEKHYRAIMEANPRPRASLTYMVRLNSEGEFMRIGERGKFSIDGVARKSSISLFCERAFFQSELGAWDCVRFGADSETIDRAERLLGDQFCEYPQVGMLCLEHDNSLTGDPEFGVSPQLGVSRPRADYAASWRKWHERFIATGRKVKLDFPPLAGRGFTAPDVMVVPLEHIQRNMLAVDSGSSYEPVTAICVSRRKEFVAQVFRNLQKQTHPDIRVIYVIHGFDMDVDAAAKELAGLKNLTVLQITDEDTFLADGLNLALDHCETDLCAKIDDDDHYGPDYIRSSELALKYSGNPNVAMTGKAAHFCYVESMNLFGIRFEGKQNVDFTRIHGGTLFWRRSLVGDQRFERVRQGTDSRFSKGVLEMGRQIYSSDPFDFVHVRYANSSSHTWKIDDEEFVRPVRRIADGLRLDLAYGCQQIL